MILSLYPHFILSNSEKPVTVFKDQFTQPELPRDCIHLNPRFTAIPSFWVKSESSKTIYKLQPNRPDAAYWLRYNYHSFGRDNEDRLVIYDTVKSGTTVPTYRRLWETCCLYRKRLRRFFYHEDVESRFFFKTLGPYFIRQLSLVTVRRLVKQKKNPMYQECVCWLWRVSGSRTQTFRRSSLNV